MIENLNNYNIFYTVAKAGNISKAAKALFISQPAISTAIAKLENELGTTLFVRSSRGVKLTEEGQLLYDYVEKALDNLNKGEENLKMYSELGVGHIRIGVSTSLCKHILLDYLKDFIHENPHIKISIDCHSTLNTLKLLESKEIDIGLICDTDIPTSMSYTPIREIHDVFVANQDYIDNLSLREANDTTSTPMDGLIVGNIAGMLNNYDMATEQAVESHLRTVDILEKSTLMMLEAPNVTRTHVDNYLASQNIRCNQILDINNMDLLIDFAAIGMGVACVVKEFAEDYFKTGQIMELPLEKPIEKRTVGFVYNDVKNKPTALLKFIEKCGI